MWRLLLARLHPDAGGDHELFAFACALKDEVYGEERHERETFLQAWQDEMERWTLHNRATLRNSRAHRSGKPDA